MSLNFKLYEAYWSHDKDGRCYQRSWHLTEKGAREVLEGKRGVCCAGYIQHEFDMPNGFSEQVMLNILNGIADTEVVDNQSFTCE